MINPHTYPANLTPCVHIKQKANDPKFKFVLDLFGLNQQHPGWVESSSNSYKKRKYAICSGPLVAAANQQHNRLFCSDQAPVKVNFDSKKNAEIALVQKKTDNLETIFYLKGTWSIIGKCRIQINWQCLGKSQAWVKIASSPFKAVELKLSGKIAGLKVEQVQDLFSTLFSSLCVAVVKSEELYSLRMWVKEDASATNQKPTSLANLQHYHDLINKIFSLLTEVDLKKTRGVCKQWRRLSNEHFIHGLDPKDAKKVIKSIQKLNITEVNLIRETLGAVVSSPSFNREQTTELADYLKKLGVLYPKEALIIAEKWKEKHPLSLLESNLSFYSFPLSFHISLGQRLIALLQENPQPSQEICQQICDSIGHLRLHQEPEQTTLIELARLIAENHPRLLCVEMDLFPIDDARQRERLLGIVAESEPELACESIRRFGIHSTEQALSLSQRFIEEAPVELCLQIHHFPLDELQRSEIALQLLEENSEDVFTQLFASLALFRFSPSHLQAFLLSALNQEIREKTEFDSVKFFGEMIHCIPFTGPQDALECLQAVVSNYDDDVETALLELFHRVPFSENSDFQFRFAGDALKSPQWMICLEQIWQFQALTESQRYLLAQQLIQESPVSLSEVLEKLCPYVPLLALPKNLRTQLLDLILNSEEGQEFFVDSPKFLQGFAPLNAQTIQTDTYLLQARDPSFSWPPAISPQLYQLQYGQKRPLLSPLEIASFIQQETSGNPPLSTQTHDLRNKLFNHVQGCIQSRHKEDLRVLSHLPLYSLCSKDILNLLKQFIESKGHREDTDYSFGLTTICEHMRLYRLDEIQRKEIASLLLKEDPDSVCLYISCFRLCEESQMNIIYELLETEEGRAAFEKHWWLFSINSLTDENLEKFIKKNALSFPTNWCLTHLPYITKNEKFINIFIRKVVYNDPIRCCTMLSRLGKLDSSCLLKIAKSIRDEGYLYLVLNYQSHFKLSEEEWRQVLLPEDVSCESATGLSRTLITFMNDLPTCLSSKKLALWLANHSPKNFCRALSFLESHLPLEDFTSIVVQMLLHSETFIEELSKTNSPFLQQHASEYFAKIAESSFNFVNEVVNFILLNASDSQVSATKWFPLIAKFGNQQAWLKLSWKLFEVGFFSNEWTDQQKQRIPALTQDIINAMQKTL